MIVKTRGGAAVEMRVNFADLGIGSIHGGWNPLGGGWSQPAVSMTPATAGGIPAVHQAVRIASDAVASLDVGIYRGQGLQKSQVTGSWQARLFAGQPNDQQTRFEFWETVEESLSYRGNAYIWMNTDPSTGRVTEWYALHPDQIQPILMNGKRHYWVRVNWAFVDPVGHGYGFYDVDESTILHIKGFGDGGAWVAPSPIDRCQTALGAAGGKISHENSTYGKGASLRGVITFPEGVSPTQLNAVKETWQSTYEGPQNAGKTGVLGGGGVFTPIGLTMADAQFVESQQFDVEQVARIFNVPASMLGGGSSNRAQAPLTPEHESQRWLTYGLNPRLMRIESALNARTYLFPSTNTYAWFNTNGFVRGDAITNAQVILSQVQSGQILVDEARSEMTPPRPPLPNGAGQVPQIVPVGGGANPVAAPDVNATGVTHPNATEAA